MAMERVLSMEDVQDGKKQFTSVHTQTDFGPYSAFPQQPGTSAAAASRGDKLSLSKSLTSSLLQLRPRFTRSRSALVSDKSPTPDTGDPPAAPLATPEVLNKSPLPSPSIQQSQKPENLSDQEDIEMIQKG